MYILHSYIDKICFQLPKISKACRAVKHMELFSEAYKNIKTLVTNKHLSQFQFSTTVSVGKSLECTSSILRLFLLV